MKKQAILKVFKSFELDTHVGPEMLSAIADRIIQEQKEFSMQFKGEWFDNHSDCYADTHELNYDTEPPIKVEGPVVPAITRKAFLKYPY